MSTIDFVVKNGLVVTENAVVLETTDSSSKDTGALVVEGGVGIEKKLYVGTDLNVLGNSTLSGDLQVQGGDLTTNQTTFNLLNTTATTVNFAGAATGLTIGATTGTATIRNSNVVLSGDLQVQGGDLTTNQTTFNLLNTTATSINAFGASSNLTIGAITGTATIRNSNVVLSGDLQVQGGDLTTNQTAFNLLNTTATTINLGGAATTLTIGALTGTTRVRNNLEVDLDLYIDGGDLIVSSSTFNLANTTATTVNFAGAATDIQIGAATGTTNVNNNLVVDLDLSVNGGDLTTNQTAFNLLNTTATTVNFAGAATTVEIGSATGTTNVNNNLVVDLDLSVNGNTTLGNSNLDIVTINADTVNTPNTIAFVENDATNSSISYPISVVHTTSGTPAAGIGTGIQLVTETSNSNNEIGATIESVATNVTSTTENFDLVFKTMSAGSAAAERVKINNIGIFTNAADTASTATHYYVETSSDGYIRPKTLANVRSEIVTTATVNAVAATTVGTITSGTWQGTIISPTYGGTGVNNGTKTITLGGNFTHSGAHTLTLTTVGNTSVTLPTSGTLATTGNLSQFASTTSSQLAGVISDETGTGALVFGTSPTITTGINAGSTSMNIFNTTATTVNAFGAASSLTVGATTGTMTLRNPTIVGTQTTQNLFNTTATTVNFAGAASTLTVGATTGTMTLRNPTIVGTQTTQDLFNTTATTVNFAGAATGLTIGATTGTATIRNSNVVLSGDLAVNGGDLTTTATTFNLLDSNATTVNFAGAATTVEIGSATGTTNVNNNLVVDLDLSVNGGDLTTTATTFNLIDSTATTVNFAGAATNIQIGAATGTTTVNNNLVVEGNLTVNGDTSVINVGTIQVEDKNIELGKVVSPTDITADGGGITVLGTTDKTFNWVSSTTSWTSSENLNLITGKTYKINGSDVLNATTLGSGVTNSSLTTVGTITSGTWQGTIISPTYGGTGVNNGTKTITLGGNFTHSGAHTLTLTTVGNTSVTLPTSGTLATTGNLSQFATTTSSQLAGVISDETGTGALVFATSPTFTTGVLTNSSSFSVFNTTATTVNAFGAASTLNIGNTASAQTVSIGSSSTGASTYNIGTGATASATIKTLNLGTGSAIGSTTNINIGSSAGGTTTINSANISMNSLADTASTATHYYIETAAGNILPKTLANVRNEIVTTATVNSAAATTVGTITSGTWQGSAVGVPYGGTGQTTYTNGQLLIGNTTGNTLTKATLTGTANRILITNGAGSITINADATNANTANKIVARDASGNFSAGTITAALTGNASTATTLETARTINGTSFNGSANITTANWGTSRTLTIGNTGKSVNGSANVSWSLAEIGVNNATLTLATSGIATGSQTFTANQGTAATFTVNVPATDLSLGSSTGTVVQINSSTGTNITLPVASETLAGIITNSTQSISGLKTFNNSELRIGSSNTENYISFRGTTGDGPGLFNHTYIGEYLYSGTESSELILFKGNDIEGVPGPDRIRSIASNHVFQTYTSALSGTFNAVASSTAPLTRMIIRQDGKVGIGTITPSTELEVNGTVTATTFSGSLSGNASTATTLETARTINGTSFNGSANITTANWGTSRTLTIGSTGKSVNGSANVSWSLAEIGVNNATLTLATSGIATGSQTFTANQGTAATFTVNVPGTNISEGTRTTTTVPITSSTGTNATLSAATTLLAGVMTSADKTKLDGIAAGAQVNVATNLGYTTAASTGTLTSSTGTNATIPAATTSLAGLLTGTDKTKLDGIAAGAQVNVATNLGITAGTTAGPIVTSSTGTNATLPTASDTASGVVTTGAQTWAGVKTFNSTISGSINGNAATATTLQTARTIGGVSFDGSANINLPGVNTTGNQNTTGSAATLTTARTIGGVSFDGSANINLPGVNTTGNQNTTGSAATLTTARTINGTSFNGSANITTANWGTARTLTIGNTGKSVNGSADVTWSLAEIGATPLSIGGTLDVNAGNTTGLYQGSTGSWTNRGPAANNAGALLSINTHPGNYFSQFWFDTGGGGFYHRAANNVLPTGVWQRVFADDYHPNADTLTTARTINGTSFDGSANITTANWGTSRTIWGQSINGSANITTPVRPAAGSVTAPAFSVSSDTNTGIYFSAADTLNISTGGTLAATFSSTGNFTAVGEVTAYSDARLKDNIKVIADPLTKILNIRGVTFTRNDQADQTRTHMGVIAQEVEEYFPEVVNTDDNGIKTVNYGAMAGAFIEAFKEQQSQINELKALVKELLKK